MESNDAPLGAALWSDHQSRHPRRDRVGGILPDTADHAYEAIRRSEGELTAAQEQFDILAEVLRQEGAVVRRPAPMDFFTEVARLRSTCKARTRARARGTSCSSSTTKSS